MIVANPQGQKLNGVRKVIAERMCASLQNTAQLTYHADADVTALMALRQAWKVEGRSPSLEDCLIHALAETLKAFEAFNGVSDSTSLILNQTVDLSIAISTPHGLMSPVLRDIGGMSLEEISVHRRDLIERAMNGKLSVSEMKGGSFTLSNLGQTRVRYFTPILNAGQVGLLGLGRLQDTFMLTENDRPVRLRALPLSLTADHRIVDGEPAGRFLDHLCGRLESFDAAF
jgi:pyruvate/2-oxoglutarate dehydrogenase complex dihydrolipoamide acyltransferase (E2) component